MGMAIVISAIGGFLSGYGGMSMFLYGFEATSLVMVAAGVALYFIALATALAGA